MAWVSFLVDVMARVWPSLQASGDLPATLEVRDRCPRCEGNVRLVDEHGALHEAVCPRCQGRFLHTAATERVLIEELGVERTTLRELAEHFRGPRLPCAGCGGTLSPLVLRGVEVALCVGCGCLCATLERSLRSPGGATRR